MTNGTKDDPPGYGVYYLVQAKIGAPRSPPFNPDICNYNTIFLLGY